MVDGFRLLTTAELAAMLGLSTSSVRTYARSGQLPVIVTPGGQYRFPLADVLKALRAEPLLPRHPE